jgi:hypothetical protein
MNLTKLRKRLPKPLKQWLWDRRNQLHRHRQRLKQMDYPPLNYPHGYTQFTVQVYVHKKMLAARELAKPNELFPPPYPVDEFVKQYGANEVRKWIGTYCEIGTTHFDNVTYSRVMADIAKAQATLTREEHAAI